MELAPRNREGQIGQVTNPLRHAEDRRLPKIAGPCSLVLFGITGDLSQRKVLPALYDLASHGLLPPSFAITAVARKLKEPLEDIVERAVRDYAQTPFNQRVFDQFVTGLTAVMGQYDDLGTFERLAERLSALDTEYGTGGNHAFYLAVPPDLFETVLTNLGEAGLSDTSEGWRRVVIEKPFGHDLESSQELNDLVTRVFDPEDVFRIDHYLGKETVQNLMSLRFSNELYEPLWNSDHIDHVQITMAEHIGIGSRAGYYDGVGSAKDVIQNHLLQLLALTAMEEPVTFSPDDLRQEKEKVLAALDFFGPIEESAVRAQYSEGWQGGKFVKAYLDEDNIDQSSKTDTYAALRLGVRTRRWNGVPFYVRTGKRLARRVTEIAIVFKKPSFLPFDPRVTAGQENNTLVIRIQPDEGVTFRFGVKIPGASFKVRDVTMDFSYGHAFTEYAPEAYERLILDVLLGEPPLFPQQKEVEESWKILDRAFEYWNTLDTIDTYAPGSWGPASSDEMLARDGRAWRRA
ncbi:glucose-6-phosphate dehydrogenase [Flaviflexus equikiangi]|uniref:Glucose-6-phosphate 1-dehydrogenase n=1 Tax=Flaviflexus equikiangi TaxID=2758573 RepID=A0ABS2TJY9_9ACTO|nr:glucose-6-phosphate dehydrogenase [Flaviflexus equikiangi]